MVREEHWTCAEFLSLHTSLKERRVRRFAIWLTLLQTITILLAAPPRELATTHRSATVPSRNTADLVLHPVRLRIIQTLLGGIELTTAQIAAKLSDVATATLYRQISTLVEAGVLDVVGERRVRGAVERTYKLHVSSTEVSDHDLAKMSAAEHKQAFATFVASLLANFDAYADRGDVDMVRDRVGYRHRALWLTDEEMDEFLAQIRGLYAEKAQNEPGKGRVRRLVSNVFIPAFDEPDDSQS